MNEKRDLFTLDRLHWLQIWMHYCIWHPSSGGVVGLSFEHTGHAGKGLYPVVMMGRDYLARPESFNEFAGLDRLRPAKDFGRWYGQWPQIYWYYDKHHEEIKF